MSDETPAASLPSPLTLATDTLSVFMKDVGPLILAYLPALVASMISAAVVVPLAMGCLFGGFFGSAGLAATMTDGNGEMSPAGGLVLFVGMISSYLGFFLVVLLGSVVTTAPVHGSVMRAVDAHVAGEETASFGAGFSTALRQPVQDISVSALFILLVLLGLPFLYIGALVPLLLFGFAPMAVYLDGDPPLRAFAKSFRHTRQNFTWHLAYTGVAFVAAMVAGNVPVVGPAALLLFHVRAYRAAFPRQPRVADDT